ncbi:MAG: malonyl-ACP O-methyltransferase BioC, partial [Halioglobus sp.]|nr:malonyl-ACP O-methyltransferase BioC [Halioglobus sp.]
AALRRFDALQARGSPRERALLREVRRGRKEPAGDLLPSLDWLLALDQRAQLQTLDCPQAHLFAAGDALVTAQVAANLGAMLPAAAVEVVADSSHLLPLEQPAEVARFLRAFLSREGLLGEVGEAPGAVSKADVAASFSRAARQYDSVAALQRDVGHALLERLDRRAARPAVVLDLGCGTGYFAPHLRERFPAATHIGLDIAEGMVGYARERAGEGGSWLVGDAEELPLAAGSVDLVFSSLALQWCARTERLFRELHRVLAPGGLCVFTSLGPETLSELREAWAAVDTYQHVNTFIAAAELEGAVAGIAALDLALQSEIVVMQYQRVRQLLDELKTLGAHNMNSARQPGLTSRRALQGMLQAYEERRRDGQLPATYEVYYGVLQRT